MDISAKNSALLLAGVLLLVYTASATESLMQGCSQPEDRCLPIRFCPVHFNRAKANAHVFESHFRNQLRALLCEPEKRTDNSFHVCCPKEKIRCSWKDSAAACTRPERCPSFSNNNNERELLLSNDTTLCYVHNQKKFYCCSDPLCEIHTGLCDADDDTPMWERPQSAFPSCEGEGSLVPRALCNNSEMFPDETKTCCKPSHTSRLIPHPKAALLAKMQCGVPGDVFKIQKGWETQPGEFPWMAVLKYPPNSNTTCTGTLIHPRYVLTAARCIKSYQPNQVTVRLGVYDLLQRSCKNSSSSKCPSWKQAYFVETLIVHGTHDIGLLRLSRAAGPVPGAVEPICLPIYGSLLMHLPTKLIITGWGLLKHDRDPTSRLVRGSMQIVQNQAGCEIGHSFCAKRDDDMNYCPGDTGGPYQAPDMYNESARLVQYGLISGDENGCPGSDIVSKGTLVGHFMNWILDNIQLS
uniref:Peptidase S1 domain-containing protein n=2 Tax=Anopheles atroparvus TaxID=41427 RepID=A0AAG5DIB0_ANOAO